MWKTMSIKARYWIFYIMMCIGGIALAVEILSDFSDGAKNANNPIAIIIGFVFVVGGGIFRMTMIKCPFCGGKITDPKKAPAECPHCGKPSNARAKAAECLPEGTEQTETEAKQDAKEETEASEATEVSE